MALVPWSWQEGKGENRGRSLSNGGLFHAFTEGGVELISIGGMGDVHGV